MCIDYDNEKETMKNNTERKSSRDLFILTCPKLLVTV